MATNNALKKALILKLEHISKKALGTATQLVAAGKAATPYNNNRTAQQKFNEARQVSVRNSRLQVFRTIAVPENISTHYTAQKKKFSIKDFFSKCGQIHSFLRIWSHLLKKSLI